MDLWVDQWIDLCLLYLVGDHKESEFLKEVLVKLVMATPAAPRPLLPVAPAVVQDTDMMNLHLPDHHISVLDDSRSHRSGRCRSCNYKFHPVSQRSPYVGTILEVCT
jgi:hypothetical protein